jgi:hypothetical protein
VHYFSFGDELQSAGQLVGDFQGLCFRYWPLFADYIFEVAVGAELEDHDYVVFGKETVIDSGGEEAVCIGSFG